MMKFPLLFTVSAKASSGISSSWDCRAGSLPPIPCGIPPEFGGPGHGYSPEDLFAFSVLNCIIATFKVYCEKSNLPFNQIEGKAVLSVNKHPSEKVLCMNELEITIHVTGSSHVEKVKSTLDKAIQDCAVSNSIKSGKTFHLHVS